MCIFYNAFLILSISPGENIMPIAISAIFFHIYSDSLKVDFFAKKKLLIGSSPPPFHCIIR
jgi:hypothetical protein